MKVRTIARSLARIDEAKIANEKRALDVDEKDYESLKLLLKEDINPEESPSTTIGKFTRPEKIPHNGLFWNRESILPPILEEHKRVIKGMFNNMKESDIKGYNITIYPPAVAKEITMVKESGNDIMCRVISVLGSPELLMATTSQGKMEATCDIFMSKNQAVMLAYGVCNTVSFSFNNNSNYLFKTLRSTRGISRNKLPDKRWIIILDFISDESILTRELKSAIKSAKEAKKNTTPGEEIVLEKAKNVVANKEVNENSKETEKQ